MMRVKNHHIPATIRVETALGDWQDGLNEDNSLVVLDFVYFICRLKEK